MIIFPAIDIKDGKCVRLIKGDFNKIISYEDSPVNRAIKYSQSGFNDTATTEIYTLSLHDALPILKKIHMRFIFQTAKESKIFFKFYLIPTHMWQF